MSQGGAARFIGCVENGGNAMSVVFDLAGSQEGIIAICGPDITFLNCDCSLFICCEYPYLECEARMGAWGMGGKLLVGPELRERYLTR